LINQTSFIPVQTIQRAGTQAAADKTPAEMTKSFGEFLSDALSSVSAQEQNAQKATDKFMLGQADVSEVMIASQQAELSLQLTSQIRNKVIDAYQEIMRMQL
jgi:flagellar hook-basal body complex protein FliE